MLYREWEVQSPEMAEVQALAKQAGVGELLAGVLLARGINTPEQAQQMLGAPQALPSPFLLKDMDKAVQRIKAAVDEEEPIVIFGDYDVDGITATALLYTCLENMGAQVFYKLPSRTDSGYGLSEELVEQIAAHGISLIITVDNGTSAVEAAALARQLGVDVVMTDHHLPPPVLPEVVALVNPHLADDESPYKGLSGAGVAFMLAAALEDCPPEELIQEFGDLVAIGTIADVMKLTGYNRTLVKAGLATLREPRRPGLAALIQACGWAGKDITVENISYGIAPRLNAAGRMDDATNALHLLLAEDEEEATAIVDDLQEQNTLRQQAEQEISAVIAEGIDSTPALQRARVLVVWGENWHQGVIGIVASRLTERYGKPAIVISLEGEEGRGSGRSIGGFSLYNAIAGCADILVRYGGHNLAAGLSIERAKLEEFRTRVNAFAAQNYPVLQLPALKADVAVQLDALTVPDVEELDKLAPCGSGNPAPKFLLAGAVVDAVYSVSEGKHSRLRLRQGGGQLYAVLFGTGPAALPYQVGDTLDCILSLSVYEGKMGAQLSARIIDLRPAGLGNAHAGESALFESFVAGSTLTQQQKETLTPSREETAAVYRTLRAGQVGTATDLRPLFGRLQPVSAGQVLASVAALEELGLISKDEETDSYVAVPVQQKQSLANSQLLQRLGG
ncbi:single-stranded-DNA-specific exonuclease RecJ [Ruminococcaceae bacterium OttesenSCG-928-A16]|nr:single-stranded-DNA-specific exonuclease RecJ [Ruminococcaceae bacterium OttesenSCG-928-A16]